MPQPIDASLLAELLDKHAARLELYASQWTLWPEDCVQEAFVELARQSNLPENPVAWLYLVVRNRGLNAARSERRRSHHETVASLRKEESSREPVLNEDQLSISELLAALPQTEREIVVLRIWSELTWQQIAELVEMSSSTAHRTYGAALEKLKQQLEPPWPKPIPCHPN